MVSIVAVGILVFSEVSQAINCPGYNATTGQTDNTVQGQAECDNAKTIAWTVIGILPIGLFFALFAIFGGLGGRE